MPLLISHPIETGLLPVLINPTINKVKRTERGASAIQIEAELNPGHGDFGVSHLMDIANALDWKHNHDPKNYPRGGYGSWSFAIPVVSNYSYEIGIEDSANGFAINPTWINHRGWAALEHGDGKKDEDFVIREDVAHSWHQSKAMPGGLLAVVVQSTGHASKKPVAITAGGPLVAQQLGNSLHDYSTYVNEILKDDIDPVRKGLTSDRWWVRGWVDDSLGPQIALGDAFAPQTGQTVTKPNVPILEAYATLGNATKSAGRYSGWDTYTYADRDASRSHEMSGPMRPATLKHKIYTTWDKRDWVSEAISTNAYIAVNGTDQDHDAPAEHELDWHPKCSEGAFPFWVHKMIDREIEHPFLGSKRKGLWRRHVKIPISEKPPCNASRGTPADINGNPQETYATVASVWAPNPFQMNGLTFQARPGILNGRALDLLGRP